MNSSFPEIHGTGMWVRKEGKLMLAQRTKKSGFGEWCPPGGHVEEGETTEECAIRETHEEACIEVENVRFIKTMTDHYDPHQLTYVTSHFVSDWKSGEPAALPGECGEWSWFAWDELPMPLFRPTKLFVDENSNPLEY